LPTAEWPPQMRDALAALQPPVSRHPLPRRDPGRPKGLNALGTLARYPELAKAFHTFNGHVLFATRLSLRQRELVVLRVAWLRRCDYEWAQHVVQGIDAGLTDEEIRRIRPGQEDPAWGPLDRALLTAVDELIAEAKIGDLTWAALAEELDEEQLMDLVFTVGAYEVLAMAFHSFGVEPDEDLAPYLTHFE